MKIAVFGVGEIYEKNRKLFSPEDEIIALLDNDVNKQGLKRDGLTICSPDKIYCIDYDKIVVTSSYAVEMKMQLLNLGCSRDAIIHYEEYFGQFNDDVDYDYIKTYTCDKKSCLIMTETLGYHGGAITAVYAAMELMAREYRVLVAAADGDKTFINEFERRGISFLIVPDLRYLKWKKLEWTMLFDNIIVNTYPMMLCALEISRHRLVYLWLHESKETYPRLEFWQDVIKSKMNAGDGRLKLIAVSENAKKNFVETVAKENVGILHYGIPEDSGERDNTIRNIRFAVIGTIYTNKQQHAFLQAIRGIAKNKCEKAEFYVVGRDGDLVYAEKVHNLARSCENVYLLGELKRKDIEKLYKNIDVVVVPSLSESLPMVAVEATMNRCVCIVTTSTGISPFIHPGENGFLFEAGDITGLTKIFEWCIDNGDKLRGIADMGRKIYEENFTMRKFGDQLEQLFLAGQNVPNEG